MIASIAALIPAAAGAFALAAICVSWMRYGRLALAIRDELSACDTSRELRFTVVTMRVTGGLTEDKSGVDDSFRGDLGFRPAARPAHYQPLHRRARRPALRAAA